MRAEMLDALHRRRTGSDDAYAFVVQLVQASVDVAAGVIVVPAARVE